MPIATYSGLITAIVSHSFENTQLTSAICADFVSMTEAEVNRAIRVRAMVSKCVAPIEGEYSAMPEEPDNRNWLGHISFTLDDTRKTRLQWLDIEAFDKRAADYRDTGTPKFFTIIGDEFRFLPEPADTYTAQLIYWGAVPPISDGTQTNWLLDRHPDVYLYGCLMHAAAFLKNMDEKAMYEGWFANAVGSVEQSDRQEGVGGSLQMSVGAIV
jgi:hypothetical protein